MPDTVLRETQPDEPRRAPRRPTRTADILVAQKRTLELMVRGAPLKEVLAELAATVEALDGSDAVASILLYDSRGRLWEGATPSLPASYGRAIDGLVARPDLGTCSAAASTGQVIITRSIDRDPKWRELKALPLGFGLQAAWSQPILASDGRVLGTFGTYFRTCRGPTSLERRLVETLAQTAALAIERAEAGKQAENQQRVLDRALEAAEMGAWRYDAITQECEFSPLAQRLYGLDQAVYLHDEENIRSLLHPEDVPLMWEALGRALDPAGDGRYSLEYRVAQPDGGWRWLSVWGLAEFSAGPERRGIAVVGASRDITQQKATEQQRALLMNELSHRVKNNLAVVHSIANQTLASTPDPEDFAEAFSARIEALSRAHTLLTRAQWRGTDLRQIAATVLDPLGQGRIAVEGRAIAVPAGAAVSLCLVLHELATNAAKYGALTTPEGRVAVRWTGRRIAGGGSRVTLEWRESGGPPAVPPARQGFGSLMLEATAAQLSGEVTTDYAPAGLRCTFVCELPAP